MFDKKKGEDQGSIWVVKENIVKSPASLYYDKLDEALNEAKFGDRVRTISKPYYEEDRGQGGRAGIDPEVYFKMLIVGFFENIGSERALALRCTDSLAIRSFLKYDLTERTPDHSSLSRIRTRLGEEVYKEAFAIILEALHKHKLLKGHDIGIDTSVIQANASMRTLKNNHTGESYDEYINRIAKASGVDSENKQAVRDFDRKRKDKKMSNKDWHNPHDPEAKIGPTKEGPIKMTYKVENTVDVETGAIIQTEILPADQADGQDMDQQIKQAQKNINKAKGNKLRSKTIKKVTGDKGYYKIEQMGLLQKRGIKTVIHDPNVYRNIDKLTEEQAQIVRNAKRSVKSLYGKKISRRRGQYVERSFTHQLDNGDLRKATLHGWLNIQKRNLIAGLAVNLSLLMRSIFGLGTPKQTIAVISALKMFYKLIFRVIRSITNGANELRRSIFDEVLFIFFMSKLIKVNLLIKNNN